MELITRTKWEQHTTEFNNSDVSLEQLFNAFKSHLIALSWSESQINEYILQLAEDLKNNLYI
jgi:hypothetical protein